VGQDTTYAVYALVTDTVNQTKGVFGQASHGASFGLRSQGNAHIAGTVEDGRSFKIDHPLDPEHRWSVRALLVELLRLDQLGDSSMSGDP
jgi:hypothetical protein